MNLGRLRVESVAGQGSTFSIIMPKADPASIVKCFVDQRFVKLESDGNLCLTLIELDEGEQSNIHPESVAIEEVDDFLRRSVKHFDLVVRKSPTAWLIYSANDTANYPLFVNRLKKLWRQVKHDFLGPPLPNLVLRQLDNYQVQHCGTQILDSFHEFYYQDLTGRACDNTTNLEAENKKILVVETDKDVTCAIKSRLVANGYDVICEDNGLQALEAADTHEPDVILLNMQLPVIGGLEMLDMLTTHKPTSHIPVVAISANSHDKSDALEAGAIRFIQKPFKSDSILSALTEAMDAKQDLDLVLE